MLTHWQRKQSLGFLQSQCDDCGQTMSDKRTLANHWKRRHSCGEFSELRAICDHCNQLVTGGKSRVLSHIKRCHKLWAVEFRCDECLREFASKEDVSRHLPIHSKTPKTLSILRCDICLKNILSGNKSMYSHWLRIHAGKGSDYNSRERLIYARQPNVFCDNCGYSAKRNKDSQGLL